MLTQHTKTQLTSVMISRRTYSPVETWLAGPGQYPIGCSDPCGEIFTVPNNYLLVALWNKLAKGAKSA